MKIQHIENGFVVICVILLCYMTTKEILRFFQNNDKSTIEYKSFARSTEDTYPTFSFCFYDDNHDLNRKYGWYPYFNDDLRNENSPRFLPVEDPSAIKLFGILAGKKFKSKGSNKEDFDIRNISGSYFKSLTLKFEKLYHRIEFDAFNRNDDLRLPYMPRVDANCNCDISEKYNKSLPFYVAYQDPERMCFTRNDDFGKHIIRNMDRVWLRREELLKFGHWVSLEIFLHHPGQFLRVLDTPIYVCPFFYFDWDKSALNFDISHVSILRKRFNANTPCDPDLQNDDLQIMIKSSEKVGCIPLFWKHIMKNKIKLETCTDPKSMEDIWKLTRNFTLIQSAYKPPCNKMSTTVTHKQTKIQRYWASELTWNKGLRFVEIRFNYVVKSYQEIVNEREFGIESLWSTVGGFVGIFIGTSLSQAPRLIVSTWTWMRNTIETLLKKEKLSY